MSKNFKIFFVFLLLSLLVVIFSVILVSYNSNSTQYPQPPTHSVNDVYDNALSDFYECSSPNVTISLDSLSCVRESLEVIAKSGETSKSLSLLEGLVSEDPAYTAACHGWAHSIGFAAAESNSLPELFAISWPNCTYGFYHGVQSFHLKSMDSLDDINVFYDKICTPDSNFYDKDRFIAQCSHLLGHFVADLASSSLTKSINSCFELTGYVGAPASCADGVIMRFAEFVDLENGGEDTFTEQSFDVSSFDSVSFFGGRIPDVLPSLMSLCLDLPKSSELTCAKRIPTLVFRLAERDLVDSSLRDKWSVVHSFCEGFSSDATTQCFEGIGIAALNMSGWSPEILLEACTSGKSFSGNSSCVQAVALAFAYNNPSSSPEESFCKFVPSALLPPCVKGFNSGL
jgi:hypothetical protein